MKYYQFFLILGLLLTILFHVSPNAVPKMAWWVAAIAAYLASMWSLIVDRDK